MVRWRRFGIGLLTLITVTLPVWAGVNGGGALIAVDANYVQQVGITDYCGLGTAPSACESADTEVDGADSSHLAIWKVYAAFNPAPQPRLKAVSFGISYPVARRRGLGLAPPVAHGACIGDTLNGAHEFRGEGWPNANTG